MHRRYWNAEVETLGAAAIERLESERLRQQLDYLYHASDWYRALLDDAGVRVDSIRHRDDLRRIPFTEKRELAESQRDGTLLGPHQCARREDIVRIQATGGTTGQPMRIALTRRDIEDYNEVGARALWANGCRPGEIVFECMNYNLYAGGVSDHMIFETLGAITIPFGVGQSRQLLQMMASLQDEVGIWATPSYAVRLAGVADELGIDRRGVGLRRGYFSGEAGMQIPGYRERIEELWGMTARDMYGTGELGMHSGECEHRTGLHFGATGVVLVELVDPDSGEPLAFSDGAIGEFVYTSIRRQACPLLRMRSHDLMEVYVEPCPCGRTGFRFRHLGRSDDMFIVKGVNVFPLAVQTVVSAMRPRLTGEFQILLERPPPIDYEPLLRIEVDAMGVADESLAREVRERVRAELNFSARVELVGPGAIASEKKTRRLIRLY